MCDLTYIPLPRRALLAVTGEDRVAFLQGLVSNDVAKAGPGQVVWSAFLTAQGRYLHEFFLTDFDAATILETEAARCADLARRLSLFRLRSKVAIAPYDECKVYALSGAGAVGALGLRGGAGASTPFAKGLIFVDPRLAEAGLRAWLPDGGEAALASAGFAPGDAEAWDGRRIRLGLPDGTRDLIPEKSILLENGFDELNGVDWQKGCYLGQELTARTKYRGLVRKRLMPVEIEGPAPPPGTPITLGEAEAGEMRSSAAGAGLALIRIEQFERAQAEGVAMQAAGARLRPRKPAWAVFDSET